MQVSQTYADFGKKLLYTLEDRVAQSPRALALYRWYFFLPQWKKDINDGIWFNLGLVPLVLANLFEMAVQRLLADSDGTKRGAGIGFALYIATLGAVTRLHPVVGWMVVVMTIQFYLPLWFCQIMHPYGNRLRREIKL